MLSQEVVRVLERAEDLFFKRRRSCQAPSLAPSRGQGLPWHGESVGDPVPVAVATAEPPLARSPAPAIMAAGRVGARPKQRTALALPCR